jgi:glutathione S-transferase
MPVLYDDGRELGQSLAIGAYLANKFGECTHTSGSQCPGLMGADAWEAARVTQIAHGVQDQMGKFMPVTVSIMKGEDQDVWVSVQCSVMTWMFAVQTHR